MNATELHVRVADRGLRFAVAIARAIGISAVCFRKPADGVDLCCAVRTITEVYLEQSKVGAMQHCLIRARQQDAESVGGSLAWIYRRRLSGLQRGLKAA